MALVLAVIVDYLRIGSLIRAWVRRIQDRLAEQSIASLRTRIQNQERYRDTIASYLTSDKGLYLHTLGIVLVVLLFMCAGAVVLLLEHIVPERGVDPIAVDLTALGIFAIAIVLCVYGIRLVSLDTRPKVEELLAKLDAEIAEMKAKLNGKTN